MRRHEILEQLECVMAQIDDLNQKLDALGVAVSDLAARVGQPVDLTGAEQKVDAVTAQVQAIAPADVPHPPPAA